MIQTIRVICGIWCVLFSVALGTASCAQAQVVVSNAQELSQAINNASQENTILLAPGNYGELFVYGKNFGGTLTLQAQQPSQPPIFTDIYLNTVSNMVLDTITIDAPAVTQPAWADYFRILSSSNISVKNSSIGGSDDGVNDNDDIVIAIRDSSDIQISDSIIHNSFDAVTIRNSDNVTLTGNTFTDIRVDGVIIAGSHNVVIKKNLCVNFHPVYNHPTLPDDHADCIQLWNDQETRANENITLRGNVVMRGTGERTQGIFVRGINPALPNRNLTIEHNVIQQSMGQGIHISNVDGGIIRHNSVIQVAPVLDIPQIILSELDGPLLNVSVTDNLLSFPMLSIPPLVVAQGNVVMDFDNPLSADSIFTHLLQPLNDGNLSRPVDFLSRSATGASDFASESLNFNASNLWIRHDYLASPDGRWDVLFAASEIEEVYSGQAPPAYHWSVKAPGTTNFVAAGNGETMQLSFTAAGDATIQLVATDDAGTTETITKKITIPSTITHLPIIDGSFAGGAYQDGGALVASGHPFAVGIDDGIEFGSFNGEKLSNGGSILTYPRRSELDGMDTLSLSVTVRRTASVGAWEVIAERPNTYSLWVKGDTLLARVLVEGRSTPLPVMVQNAGISTGDWTEISLHYTQAEATLSVEVDGMLKGSVTDPAAGAINTVNQYLYLGGNPWNNTFLGDISAFEIKR